MNKTFNLQKVFRTFLSIVLIFIITLSFSGCKNDTNEKSSVHSTSKTDKTSEPHKKGAEYTVISSSTQVLRSDSWYYYAVGTGETELGEKISRLLEKYKNNDVYFSFIAVFDYDTFREDTDEFARRINALYVEEIVDRSQLTKVYKIIGNSQTIDMISKSKTNAAFIEICTYEEITRPDGYSEIITDSLAYELSKLNKDEEIEVLVTTVYDKNNSYLAKHQHLFLGEYNKERNVSIDNNSAAVLPYAEYKKAAEQKVNAVIKRNNISENKILKTNINLGLSLSEEEYNLRLKNNSLSDIKNGSVCSGFTAKLTKAEILALAEDEDVKVIHNDTVISTYTVYEK